jgi:hypothetical protein
MRLPLQALLKKGATFLLHVAGEEAQKAALAWLSQRLGGEAAATIVHEATGVVARVTSSTRSIVGVEQQQPVIDPPRIAPTGFSAT